jgi:hypothetical protein
MIFKGQKLPDGKIMLVATPPPTCRERVEQTAVLWLGRAVAASLWFWLGFTIGALWGGK